MFIMETKPIFLVYESSKGRKDLLLVSLDLDFVLARCRAWLDNYRKGLYPRAVKWTVYRTYDGSIFDLKDLSVVDVFSYTPSVFHVSH